MRSLKYNFIIRLSINSQNVAIRLVKYDVIFRLLEYNVRIRLFKYDVLISHLSFISVFFVSFFSCFFLSCLLLGTQDSPHTEPANSKSLYYNTFNGESATAIAVADLENFVSSKNKSFYQEQFAVSFHLYAASCLSHSVNNVSV